MLGLPRRVAVMAEDHTHDTPYVHIGWPKTATTTLQRHFFDKHPGIENVGHPYRDPRLAAMSRRIAHDDEADFDGRACRATFDELIAPIWAATKRSCCRTSYSPITRVQTARL